MTIARRTAGGKKCRARFLTCVVAGTFVFALNTEISASAQTGQRNDQHLGKTLPPRQSQSIDEHIAMPLFPSGWVSLPPQQGSIEVTEYLPEGQTLATWRDKITVEILHGTNTLPLDAYQRRALGQIREHCSGLIEGRLQSGLNNGFPSAFWTLGCKKDKRGTFGEVRYTKVIQGSSTLYMITRAWRTPVYGDNGPPLTPAQLQEAVAFLSASVICATGTAHPCPAGVPLK